jgi:hypothetical protein
VGPELMVGLNIDYHLEARTKSCGPELGCSGWACVGELGCSRSPDQELLGGIGPVLGNWAVRLGCVGELGLYHISFAFLSLVCDYYCLSK